MLTMSGQDLQQLRKAALSRTRRPVDAAMRVATAGAVAWRFRYAESRAPRPAPAPPASSSRIGHSGRSSPWQRSARWRMASRIERSSAIFASTRATCSSANRFTSALARSRSDHSESSRRTSSMLNPRSPGAVDEPQAPHVVFAELAIAVAGARRGRDQAGLFVETDRLRRHARAPGRFTDAHGPLRNTTKARKAPCPSLRQW